MPLRFIRMKKPGIDIDPLQAAITTTAFARDLMATMQFPPASAAVSVLLLILQTIQNIQVNKSACDRLARRAAQILIDIDEQIRGRYHEAPEALLRNLERFESTLISIHQFMRKLADSKWSDRFLRKSSIDDALVEYMRMLDEAAQAFQLATLINIHLAVNSLRGSTASNATAERVIDAPPPPAYHEVLNKPDSVIEIRSPGIGDAAECIVAESDLPVTAGGEPLSPPEKRFTDHYLPAELLSLTLEDDHGFRRYHQSEVILRGRSRLQNGWWAGATEVQVQGQRALIKKYDDDKDNAYSKWLRDVKMLQNLYHPNLPQMLGFSDERAPTPFILLANVQTQSPQALVREMLRSSSLGTSIELMLRFYRDLADAAVYVQRQLSLDENKVQDFIEASSLRVDSLKTLVVGLPPPRDGEWYTARNYGLAHTLLDACLRMLPNNGRVTYSYDRGEEFVTEEMQKKINHLVTLARALLPSGRQSPVLPTQLEALIEETESKTPSLTLRQIRDLTWNSEGAHGHTWYEKNVPADKFSVGDIGYIPVEGDFGSFVLLSNVIKDGKAPLSLSQRSHGEHWCWEHIPIHRQPLQAYELPEALAGWPVAVPPYSQIDVVVVHEAYLSCVKDAWQYLLRNGKGHAADGDIRPEDLILVTHVGTHQDFYVRDFRSKPIMTQTHVANLQFAANQFHHQDRHGFHQPLGFGFQNHGISFNQPTLPAIVYLLTSLDANHEPYWSPSPVCLPKASRQPLARHFTTKIGRKTGFLNYVQLHAEDFDST
ncbi:uncharacterized protein F5891DRAFT_1062579 [Suillus fuscotomentosus]|uniref:Mixed lineage kinase domain-containing protein n=1 Tax=Suillus fuscotomentosus TaxID=1912939 RepID=A0AAD4DV80_9AGAM|nr:uncharacterized protein F5891DRAFT_1062579 [Suillus fuscotomentosus]KAG1894412.1 hypothetical protein F5891DRAFT_1062579 [Suillus fuscotomentosus]